MPQARKRLVATEVTPFYHVISRSVRRHFLCGRNPLTGRDYSARKQEIQDRLALLAEAFAIDVCAYAILSNHYHLVVHIDEQTAIEWSELEVAQRWTCLFTGPALVRAFVAGQTPTASQREVVARHVREYRNRLCDLSWFMKCLNEPIARKANAEDNVTGHFWQARFSSQALLDEAAVLTAMAYVDLNPSRAGIAETPEESDYTSIQQRIAEWRERQVRAMGDTVEPRNPASETASLEKTNVKLLQFRGDSDRTDEAGIPYSTADYLELVDWVRACHCPGQEGVHPRTPPADTATAEYAA